MDNKLALTVDEAADAAGIGHTKLRAEITAGRLPARRMGKIILIAVADLQTWLESLPKYSVAA
jgi:excisionase family DNA binding protein